MAISRDSGNWISEVVPADVDEGAAGKNGVVVVTAVSGEPGLASSWTASVFNRLSAEANQVY